MTPLKPEHQGEGTYDYACRDAGCWFCDMMKPQLIVDDPEIPIFKQTGHGYAWTRDEIDTLMNNMHLPYVSLVKLLPGRTPGACSAKKIKLSDLGVIKKAKRRADRVYSLHNLRTKWADF